MNEPATYSWREVCSQTGATYRQLCYWTACGNLPDTRPEQVTGSGYRRWFTEADLQIVRLLVRLSRAGVSLARLSAAVRNGEVPKFLAGIQDAIDDMYEAVS